MADINPEEIQKRLFEAGAKTAGLDDSALAKVVSWVQDNMLDMVAQGFERSDAKEKVLEFLGSVAKQAADKGADVFGAIYNSKIVRYLTSNTFAKALGLDLIPGQVENIFSGIKGFMNELGVVNLEFSFDSLESQAASLRKMLGEGGMGNLATWYALDAAAAKLNTIRATTGELTKNLDVASKAAGTLFSERSNPFGVLNENVASSTNSLKKFQREFTEENIRLQFSLGINAETSKTELENVYRNMTDYAAQLSSATGPGGSGFQIVGEGKTVKGAEAIIVAAKAIGVTTEELARDVDNMTSRFGLSGEQAAERIMTIGKASSSSGLALSTFKTLVMESAKDFGAFGDATEESAALLDRFVRNADPSRLRAVTDAFSNVTRGIAGMSDEMKAFVAMGTELSGGGGAIESIVRLEEALQSGDKDALQGIFEETMARIEELTGAPVMTMKEAVQSGQESTYYQQAALAKQFGMAENRAQASDVFEAYRTGRFDIDTIKGRADPDLTAAARLKTTSQMTSGEIGENLLRAAGMQAQFNALWADATDSFMAQTQELGKKMVDVTSKFSQAEGSIFEALKKAAEESAFKRAATDPVLGTGTRTAAEHTTAAATERVADATAATAAAGAGRVAESISAITGASAERVAGTEEADMRRASEAVNIFTTSVAAASAEMNKILMQAAAPGAAPTAPAAPPEPVVVKVEVELKGDNVKDMITVRATQVAVDATRRSAGMSPPPP